MEPYYLHIKEPDWNYGEKKPRNGFRDSKPKPAKYKKRKKKGKKK